jgi:paraquat-inducible protein A
MNSADIRNLCISSFALLIAGVFLPCMTVLPHAGEYTGLIKIFAPHAFDSTTYSLIGGIFQMMKSDMFIGVLLLLFSIVFPLWKLGTFIYYLLRKKTSESKSLSIALKMGKYSMLDVFVLAVIVIAVKGLPGGSKVILEPGLYFFGASILLSIFIGQKITKVKPQQV